MADITITGNLAEDPELRFTPSGAAVTKLRVIENHRKRNQADEWVDNGTTTWFIEAWRQLGENAAESLHKGSLVTVTGTVRQDSYETNGETKYVMKVTANDIAISLRHHTIEATKATRSSDQGE